MRDNLTAGNIAGKETPALDLVTKSLVESFRQQHGFPADLEPPTLFEHFANFCIGSRECSDEFEVDDLHVAGGNDLQLDGVIVMANGILVESTEEVDDLAKTNKYLDAEFVFIQTKMGSDFAGAEISNMFYGVRDLFADVPSLPRNELLAEKESVIKHIYSKSALFRHGNPRLRMYYVTTGRWQDDDKILARNLLPNSLAQLCEIRAHIEVLVSHCLKLRLRRATTETVAYNPYLDKVVSNHVTDPPGLVRYHGLECLQKVRLALLWRELLCNCNKVCHGQQTHRVLLVLRQFVE